MPGLRRTKCEGSGRAGSDWVHTFQLHQLHLVRSRPIPARVSDLLARMTPDEKFRQLFMVVGELWPDSTRFTNGLFGFQVNATQQRGGATDQLLTHAAGPDAQRTLDKVNGMQRFFLERTRLGIPMIAFDEALYGLVRNGATALPPSIALATSFDTTLMDRVCTAIALETKARGIRMVLSPVVNLDTDLRWGRAEEVCGVDPLLASWMGATCIKAMESRGILTTPKHFAVNHGDGGRDSYPMCGASATCTSPSKRAFSRVERAAS